MVSIGRTGRATPFAVLEPVFVGGANVGMATLHNEDDVARKDVRPGDTVIVRRAGDVIPEVVGPVLAKRPPKTKPWKFPKKCPVCGQPLVRVEGEANHHCVNVDCPAQRVQRLVHWASRGAMDIEGLGEERVRQFVEAGLLEDAADVYSLTVDALVPLDRIGERSAQLLVDGDREVETAAAVACPRRARHQPRRSHRRAGARPIVRRPRRDHGRERGRAHRDRRCRADDRAEHRARGSRSTATAGWSKRLRRRRGQLPRRARARRVEPSTSRSRG